MIDFKSIIENLRETADNYERHLTEIDQFLSEKGLLDDYRDFVNRKLDKKQQNRKKKKRLKPRREDLKRKKRKPRQKS